MKATNANPLKELQRFNRNIDKVFDEISKSKRVKRKYVRRAAVQEKSQQGESLNGVPFESPIKAHRRALWESDNELSFVGGNASRTLAAAMRDTIHAATEQMGHLQYGGDRSSLARVISKTIEHLTTALHVCTSHPAMYSAKEERKVVVGEVYMAAASALSALMGAMKIYLLSFADNEGIVVDHKEWGWRGGPFSTLGSWLDDNS